MNTPSSSTPWIRVNPKPLPPPRFKRTSQAFRQPPIPPTAQSGISTDNSGGSWDLNSKRLFSVFSLHLVFSPNSCAKQARMLRIRGLVRHCFNGRETACLRSVRPAVTEAAKPVSTHGTHLHYLTPLLLLVQLDRALYYWALRRGQRQHCIVRRETVTCHYGPTCPNFCLIMPVMAV